VPFPECGRPSSPACTQFIQDALWRVCYFNLAVIPLHRWSLHTHLNSTVCELPARTRKRIAHYPDQQIFKYKISTLQSHVQRLSKKRASWEAPSLRLFVLSWAACKLKWLCSIQSPTRCTFLCILLYFLLYMFRVLFAPILRSTTAAYSHRCVYGFVMLVHCSCYYSLFLYCATLTVGFPCFFLSFKANARI
jgi:hypothetical protein